MQFATGRASGLDCCGVGSASGRLRGGDADGGVARRFRGCRSRVETTRPAVARALPRPVVRPLQGNGAYGPPRSGAAPDLRSQFVAVQVDSDQRPDLVRRFHIEKLPTDVFVDPRGYVLERSSGSKSRERYFSLVARIDAICSQSRSMRIASQTKTLSRRHASQ